MWILVLGSGSLSSIGCEIGSATGVSVLSVALVSGLFVFVSLVAATSAKTAEV
ncbi:hypothetical protein H3T43_06955 [Lactobacillus sp. M0396]|nr:hypothetical protein [Lactobacillus sp. M0396]